MALFWSHCVFAGFGQIEEGGWCLSGISRCTASTAESQGESGRHVPLFGLWLEPLGSSHMQVGEWKRRESGNMQPIIISFSLVVCCGFAHLKIWTLIAVSPTNKVAAEEACLHNFGQVKSTKPSVNWLCVRKSWQRRIRKLSNCFYFLLSKYIKDVANTLSVYWNGHWLCKWIMVVCLKQND